MLYRSPRTSSQSTRPDLDTSPCTHAVSTNHSHQHSTTCPASTTPTNSPSRIGDNGDICIYTYAETDIVVDIYGYYIAGSGGTGTPGQDGADGTDGRRR